MRYGSVCSGIEAASQAWEPLGWSPQFFSEIDAFPCAVLAHHYGSNLPGKPVGNGVPNHGDMTKFQEWPDHAIDLLVGGTPCQSFSVAGLRAGLADPRGNLMLTYLAVAAKYRPRWVAWENVPGVLSSGKGRDFGSFLTGLAELGYGFAYRVLDAQYVRVGGFGRAVPQRRRRVFVVGYLGDWRRAAAVLFDGASLRGDPAPRREAGQNSAGTIDASLGRRRGSGMNPNQLTGVPDVSPAMKAQITHPENRSNPQPGDPAGTMPKGGHPSAIAFDLRGREGGAQFEGPHETANIRAASGGSSRSYVAEQWAVRRLTPKECCRLQGFPDDYLSQVKYRGKAPADGPMYKALGNSMAVNVMRWIGERIEMVDKLP